MRRVTWRYTSFVCHLLCKSSICGRGGEPFSYLGPFKFWLPPVWVIWIIEHVYHPNLNIPSQILLNEVSASEMKLVSLSGRGLVKSCFLLHFYITFIYVTLLSKATYDSYIQTWEYYPKTARIMQNYIQMYQINIFHKLE